MTAELKNTINQALGSQSADLVIKNVNLVNVVTGEIDRSDIAICDDKIVGIYEEYNGKNEIDGSGLFAVPGFIDTHLHVESSLLTPHEFDRCVLPHGTTTAICDPHELSNVLGKEAIEYFLKASESLVMDLRVQLSSCVPATNMETSGAKLNYKDLLKFKDHPKVIGLAEFMNFPGIFHKDEEVLEKLEAFKGCHIDGHCPLVSGKELNAYCAVGIKNCHESTTYNEAKEKLRKGMQVLMRGGSVSKDVTALAPLLDEINSPFMAFCTDDRNPLDIADRGHIDHLIRLAIKAGASPIMAYRAASWSAAQGFGLKDRGIIAPSYLADIVLLENLEKCTVNTVIKAGKIVTPDIFTKVEKTNVGYNTVKRSPVNEADFCIKSEKTSTTVIGIIPNSIITEKLELNLPVKNGKKHQDQTQDTAKVCVLTRHGSNDNIGRGFVKGFGLKGNCALGSTVGHDSHNICVVGTNDADMTAAVNRLIELGGGFVAIKDGKVAAEIALPIGGLMSDKPYREVEETLRKLRSTTKNIGITLDEPFLQLAFLPLPVIPHLKITDFGLFDVDSFKIIEE